ncbi:MAG: TetR family transcriptional regulator [Corynebacterium sp.]|nr:TetR family transcriptional regulator [Corynebacterium sp.]
MRHLSAEQLLLVADEFCAHHRVAIVDYAAICAAASITGGQFEGVPVHRTIVSARASLERAITALMPLNQRNQEFAVVAGEVFARVNS